MNGYQRVMAVLRGELPDRVPVCLHNFLPAAREAGIPLEQLPHANRKRRPERTCRRSRRTATTAF